VIKIFKRRKKSDRARPAGGDAGKTARAGTSGGAKSAAARLARSEQRYRALIETMNEGFCVLQMLFDEAGQPSDYRFLEANPAFVKHTGLEAAIGKTARELAPGLEPSWFERYGRVALTGEPAHFVDHAEPLGRWFDVDAFRIGEPGDRQVALLFTDITTRKQAEEAMRESDRHKDEFIAMLAHELRNPLAAIRTAVGVLASRRDASPLADEMSAIIARQSFQLARLIDDLLDVSRVSRGTLTLQKAAIDVRATVQQAVEDSSTACRRKGLKVTAAVPEEPVLVDADPVRMTQVVNNLVQNACQFTPKGGSIHVAVERTDDVFVLRVTDSGVGMSGDALERVFDMFVQLEEPDIHRTEGLGIGLSIARHIVELHGGRIEASSSGPGQGSEFVVSMPLSSNSQQGDEAWTLRGAEPAPAFRGPRLARILVADDSRDALRALALMLRARGYEVTTAIDGADALEKAIAQRPDIAVLDIGMPRMDGYEAARRIRRAPWGERMLLVALTGWGQEHDRRQALEAGFDVHLTKPADLGVLEEVIAGRRGPDARHSADHP
jgi:PAS domain S-box-containing protein